MKVAVLFFGQIKRYTDAQHKTFKKFFFPSLKEAEVDYFNCTSKRGTFHNPRNTGEGKVDCHYDSIKLFYKFHAQWFDGLENGDSRLSQKIDALAKEVILYGRPWGKHSEICLVNSLRQIASLEILYKKFINSLDYDLYILCRSDLWFTKPLGSLNRIFQGGKTNDLFVPVNCWFEGGCNDRFAITKSPLALQAYCSRFSRILSVPEYYHAEQYLLKHMYRQGLDVRRIPSFEHCLVRGNGKVTNVNGMILDGDSGKSISPA